MLADKPYYRSLAIISALLLLLLGGFQFYHGEYERGLETMLEGFSVIGVRRAVSKVKNPQT